MFMWEQVDLKMMAIQIVVQDGVDKVYKCEFCGEIRCSGRYAVLGIIDGRLDGILIRMNACCDDQLDPVPHLFSDLDAAVKKAEELKEISSRGHNVDYCSFFDRDLEAVEQLFNGNESILRGIKDLLRNSPFL